MKLSEIIKVWEILHTKDTGEIGFCDLEKAIDKVVGVNNNINPCQPIKEKGEDTNGKIIKNLKRIRFEKGLTQWKLSLLSGVMQSRISLIENGLVKPTIKEIEGLESALSE